jgi:DNA-binding XRE family transcriptional regulator
VTDYRDVDSILNALEHWCAQERGRQSEVAQAIGVQRYTINDWIRGRSQPNLRDGLRLIDFLKRHRLVLAAAGVAVLCS